MQIMQESRRKVVGENLMSRHAKSRLNLPEVIVMQDLYSGFEKGCRKKSAHDNPERYCG